MTLKANGEPASGDHFSKEANPNGRTSMPIIDAFSDATMRKILNADPNFEKLRYLAVLAASSEPPFETIGTPIDGKITFNVKQLWRVANHLGLRFERFRGAERVFNSLQRSGLVRVVRDERTGFHTQFCLTDLGISQTILNLDRLKKVQEFDSQAKTMQRTIKKQLATLPPTVLEVNLSQKTFTIGRDKENDLALEDQYMSSKHARVTYDNGTWIIEDLNSRNGTWKMEQNNLKRVARTQVADHDLYQLGSTVIRFRQPTTGQA